MHNAALAALGLNWRYVACDVAVERLREAIAGAAAMKFVGLNLTVPHKLHALDCLDEIEPDAKAWGAVNTVVFEGRVPGGDWRPMRDCDPEGIVEVRSRGFNTDADAIVRSIQEDLSLPLAGARVVLLGAGGAGRTAALKLASAGVAELALINRTRAKAAELQREIAVQYPGTRTALEYPDHNVDLILNATSLGLRPDDPLPMDTARFPFARAAAVYDMIYRPAETPFLCHAARAGCKTANGLGMLLFQGAKALELWTGQRAPIEIMRQALVQHIYWKS